MLTRLVQPLLPSLRSCARQFSLSPSRLALETAPDGLVPLDRIRNIAIIAHVDHGKTTLVDKLLRQSGTLKQVGVNEVIGSPVGSAASSSAFGSSNAAGQVDDGYVTRVMDSNDLERERGITILSKCTSVHYRNHLINIVDTPGHADFGGEVERIMTMVDGVVLVVDATDGPMTQTRFVLGKALSAGLQPIVVINKADRITARPEQVDSDIMDLFDSLEASEKQMEYPILYASAKQGWATSELAPGIAPGLPQPESVVGQKMAPLFDQIMSYIPKPTLEREKPFSMLTTQIESDPYVGVLYLGRIHSGIVRIGQKINAIDTNGKKIGEGKCTKIFGRVGLERIVVEQAGAGEIVSVAGISGGGVNVTLVADDGEQVPLPSIPLDPPTLSMFISANSSPFAGQEGTKFTFAELRDRLNKEAETNVALHVLPFAAASDTLELRGRGVLHLGILLETLRREGFEMAVTSPTAVMKLDENGKKMEPVEEASITVAEHYAGTVVEKLTKRKGEMLSYDSIEDGKVRIVMNIPARGLFGYISGEFKNDVHGEGTLNHIFKAYELYKGPILTSRKGALISTSTGETSSYALSPLQARGTMFVGAQEKVYTGMVVGESTREQELNINPCAKKALTNMRAAGADDKNLLIPPKRMTLEEMIAYIADDEIIEITPKCVRLRKRELDESIRRKANRDVKKSG